MMVMCLQCVYVRYLILLGSKLSVVLRKEGIRYFSRQNNLKTYNTTVVIEIS